AYIGDINPYTFRHNTYDHSTLYLNKTVFLCSLNIPLYHLDPAYHFPIPHRRITPFQTDPPYSISIRHTTNKQWRTRHCYKHPHANTYIQIFRRAHPTQPACDGISHSRKEAQLQRTHSSHTTYRQSPTKTPTLIPHKITHKGEK